MIMVNLSTTNSVRFRKVVILHRQSRCLNKRLIVRLKELRNVLRKMENNTLHMTTEGMPFPPSVNHYLGYRAVRKGKGAMVMAYTTKEAKQFQKIFSKYLEELIKETGWDKEVTRDKYFYLEATYYFDKKGKDESN